MRAVVQRVSEAQVALEVKVLGKIEKGLLVFLAVHASDHMAAGAKLAEKIINLRIFKDTSGKMNLSVREVGGEILVVPQFTLYADTSKGNRPSFGLAAKPEKAIPIYESFVAYVRNQGFKVATGEFGATMKVDLANDGPVTIIIDI